LGKQAVIGKKEQSLVVTLNESNEFSAMNLMHAESFKLRFLISVLVQFVRSNKLRIGRSISLLFMILFFRGYHIVQSYSLLSYCIDFGQGSDHYSNDSIDPFVNKLTMLGTGSIFHQVNGKTQ
jgi:hypothetical protein